ncbi:MAG TPA: hypothetical protein VHG91_14920 [Longimicrobium sp.]|nr:hypothetical protein [Longimicrobium sp.]
MKKLSLTLEALAVDSFDTGAAASADGTVHGQEATAFPYTGCCVPTKPRVTCIEPCIPPPPD